MVIWSQLPLLAIDSMSTKRFLAMLFAANILTGCAVGPDYVRPTLPMPDRFQGQAEVDQRHAAANADLATWWTGFGDPQLTRYVTIALEQNLDLAQASARVNAQIQQARGQQGEMLAVYQLAALHATEDVENAFSALVKREEQSILLNQSVNSLARACEASFAAYQKGSSV